MPINLEMSAKPFKVIAIMLLLPIVAYGATYTATNSGNWNSVSTWGGMGYPQAGDNAIINQAYTITLTTDAACVNLENSNNGVIALANNSLSVSGNVTFNCTAGTFTTTTGYVILNGTSQTINLCTGGGANNCIPNLRLVNSTSVSIVPQGNFTITGNFDCQTGSSSFSNNDAGGWASGTFKITGTCTAPNCTFIAGTNINGTSMDFSSCTSNPVQVGGVNDSQSNAIIDFGSKDVYATKAFAGTNVGNIKCTGTVTVLSNLKQFKSNVSSGRWNVKKSWLQSTDGGVNWVAATNSPTATDIVTIQNGNTITLSVDAAALNLTVNGSLDVSSFALKGSGILSVSSTGTILVGGTSNFPTGFKTNTLISGSTVNYYSNGLQIISNQAYSNLTLSGSQAKALPAGVTSITGNLTLIGAATTATVVGLTIGGNLVIGNGASFTANGYSLSVGGATTVGSGASGELNFTSATGTKTFNGLVTVNAGGTWNNNVSGNNLTFRGGITNAGVFTAGTGVYTFDTRSQTLIGTMSIPNVTVNGVVLTNNGTLTVGTSLSGNGGLAQATNASLYIGGSSGITTLSATNSGNFVSYNGLVNQNVSSVNYCNLALAGSGLKTIASSISVSANLSVSGSKANLNSGVNVLANSLSLGGIYQADGTYGSTTAITATNKNDTYFAGTGIVTINSSCGYDSAAPSGLAIFTPVIDMPTHVQQVSTTFTSGKYFVMNVIKGLIYQVYTTNSPASALKMAVYEEGNSSGPLLASSITNAGNPGSSNVNNVYLSFTSPLSGQIRVLITSKINCSSTSITGLTVNTNVIGGNNLQDDPTSAGTNTWIGQIYDSPSGKFLFENYLGYYNVGTETFSESFGTGPSWPSDDVTSFGVNSNGTQRATELDKSFNVRYLMNSTRRGFYAVNISSDDGAKLTVDGNIVYNHWDLHSPQTNNNVLLSLAGNSSLTLDYFEQAGQNGISFNLVLILENNLSGNTSQVVCAGTSGLAISGDLFPATLISGMYSPGYQWYYSTPADPTRRIIPNANSATFTPTASDTPFNNISGVYYLYRIAKLSTTNNLDPNPYNATNESNAAIVRVRACPNFWVGDTGATGSDWNTASNWSDGVPYPGDDVVFATPSNLGNDGLDAVNNLVLDNDYVVGNFTNQSGKQLIVAPGTSLKVNGSITTDNNNQIYIRSNGSQPNGSLIFPNATNVKATVEMYTKAQYYASPFIDSSTGLKYHYTWQYFGIPLRSVVASPTFDGSFLRKNDEWSTNELGKWSSLANLDVLTSFKGYEITQDAPTIISFQGELENSPKSFDLAYTSGAYDPGQNMLANPYTAAINIKKLTFASTTTVENTVYLYNTGSFADWSNYDGEGLNSSAAIQPGQYIAIPQNAAGTGSIPYDIPSMSAFMVKAISGPVPSGVTASYSSVVTKNVNLQHSPQSKAFTDKVYMEISLKGEHNGDCMWLINEPGTTRGFDNGWDGFKLSGAVGTPKLFALEESGNYQVSTSADLNNTYLGFQAGIDLEDTLTFKNENIASRYGSIYLIDLVEKKIVDITKSGMQYAFKAESTIAPIKRFKIVTEPTVTNTANLTSQLKVFNDNTTVFVDNSSNQKGELHFYDLMGRYLKKENFGPNSISSFPLFSISGAYIVKAVINSERVSKQIIVKQ